MSLFSPPSQSVGLPSRTALLFPPCVLTVQQVSPSPLSYRTLHPFLFTLLSSPLLSSPLLSSPYSLHPSLFTLLSSPFSFHPSLHPSLFSLHLLSPFSFYPSLFLPSLTSFHPSLFALLFSPFFSFPPHPPSLFQFSNKQTSNNTKTTIINFMIFSLLHIIVPF